MLPARILLLATLTLSVTACGGNYLAAPAPIRVLARAWNTVNLMIQGKYVPPPPLNRDDTISGPDADLNGVRDDIDAYIASLVPDSDLQKAALRQAAAAIRLSMLVDTSDPNMVNAATTRISNAVSCLYERYPSSLAIEKNDQMELFTVNTRRRLRAYLAFNGASGNSTLPRDSGCLE